MVTFSDRLKSAMEQKHLKQVDLIRIASQQGVKLGKSHISQYVSGKTIPRMREQTVKKNESFVKICRFPPARREIVIEYSIQNAATKVRTACEGQTVQAGYLPCHYPWNLRLYLF